ncbi:DNA topoisomerase VI subunit B [archaeon]|nr:DNA topoisomerase VI subunit B [archaeon]|tara:strand:+ start:1097 stop:2668 length:1572 start_codon:yes stop_codon:yes gene_type:complete
MANPIRAEELAKEQREISISAFFEKNRHLLGFDNPIRALLTTVKELVDNSLDATEDMKVLPEIKVIVKQVSDDRFKVIVEDNGPGIVKEQIPKIFAKLLYGSKFFKLKMSRGQQGIGVSASVLYGQLTTGKPVKITSKISPRKPAHYYELHIDTHKNDPEIVKEIVVDWIKKHGTKVEIELEAKYQKGRQSIDEYLKQTALINPQVCLTYTNPDNKTIDFPKATKELPKEPKEIKPHPHGIELGILIRMLKATKAKTLQSFLTTEFCRVGSKTAKNICEKANVVTKSKPGRITRDEADNLIKSIRETRLIAPPTDCLSPIGPELLEKGLKKEIDADFYATITRPPSVYRGMPFQIEAGICYGGTQERENSIRVLRFANRVPLLYQQSACAVTRSITATNWRLYGLQQSRGSLPMGPVTLIIHIASVWVPFTSESKEAIAHYPEIVKEIKLALQDCGRKLGGYIRKHIRAKEQKAKFDLFEKYIPELANSLSNLTKENKEKIIRNLKSTIRKGLPELNNENAKR